MAPQVVLLASPTTMTTLSMSSVMLRVAAGNGIPEVDEVAEEDCRIGLAPMELGRVGVGDRGR